MVMTCKTAFVKYSAKRLLMALLLLFAVCHVTEITHVEAAEKQKTAASVETSAGT